MTESVLDVVWGQSPFKGLSLALPIYPSFLPVFHNTEICSNMSKSELILDDLIIKDLFMNTLSFTGFDEPLPTH